MFRVPTCQSRIYPPHQPYPWVAALKLARLRGWPDWVAATSVKRRLSSYRRTTARRDTTRAASRYNILVNPGAHPVPRPGAGTIPRTRTSGRTVALTNPSCDPFCNLRPTVKCPLLCRHPSACAIQLTSPPLNGPIAVSKATYDLPLTRRTISAKPNAMRFRQHGGTIYFL